MLIKLTKGIKCKHCKGRMNMAKDIPGTVNLVLTEDKNIDYGDFMCKMTCE